MDLLNKLKHAIKHKTINMTSATDPDFDPDANLFLGMRDYLDELIKSVVHASEQFEAFCNSCAEIGVTFGRYPNENDPPQMQKLAESYNAKMDQLSSSLKADFKVINQRRESKRDFEYYNKKVDSLRKVDKQDAVRNVRNDEKFRRSQMDLEKYTYMANQQIKYYLSKRDKLIKYEFAHFRSIQKEIFEFGHTLLRDFVTLPAGERDTVSFDPPNLENTSGMPVLMSSSSNSNPPPLPSRPYSASFGGSSNYSSSQFQNSTLPQQSIRPGLTTTPFGQSVLPSGQTLQTFAQSSAYGNSMGLGNSSLQMNQSVAPYNPGASKVPIAPLANLSASAAPAPLPTGGFGKKGFSGFSVALSKPPLPPPPGSTTQQPSNFAPQTGATQQSNTTDLFSALNFDAPSKSNNNNNNNTTNNQNVDVFDFSRAKSNSDPFADLLNNSNTSATNQHPLPQIPINNNTNLFRAVYQYKAADTDELSLEIVTVSVQDESGWWIGTKPGGREGIFPGKYVVPHQQN